VSKKIISAGGVIYRIVDNSNIEIYLCYHKKYGLVLPKGKLEKNETILECAKREVDQETGFRLFPKQDLGQLEYSFDLDGKRVDKVVYFFAFPYISQTQNINTFLKEQNITVGKWVKLDEVTTQTAHNSEAQICLNLKKVIL